MAAEGAAATAAPPGVAVQPAASEPTESPRRSADLCSTTAPLQETHTCTHTHTHTVTSDVPDLFPLQQFPGFFSREIEIIQNLFFLCPTSQHCALLS